MKLAPIPVDNRFYAVIVQSGMSARRVLSLPPADVPDAEVPSVNGAGPWSNLASVAAETAPEAAEIG